MSSVDYICNLCGTGNTLVLNDAWREGSFCARCRANGRYRLVTYALTVSLFGESLVLADMVSASKTGIGLSDSEIFAGYASKALNYRNTYFHQEPQLDIVDPASCEGYEGLDFVVSSDVFEHVPPPPDRAFKNAYTLLKPGGVLIFSAPYTDLPSTIERYPELWNYRIEGEDEHRTLINYKRSGERQEFSPLIFHGGEGSTLEMRVYCEHDLWRLLREAGFSKIELFDQPVFKHGIYWKNAYHDYIEAELGGYVFAATKEPSY